MMAKDYCNLEKVFWSFTNGCNEANYWKMVLHVFFCPARALQRYTMPTEDVMRNKARAVSGWLGPFSKKTFSTFPEYEVGGANRSS